MAIDDATETLIFLVTWDPVQPCKQVLSLQMLLACLPSRVKVCCYFQSVVTLANLIMLLTPSTGPHTTCLVLDYKEMDRVLETKPPPQLCRVSLSPSRNICSFLNVCG